MLSITTPAGEILATHTTHHPRSSYGALVWSVEIEEPGPGPVILAQKEPPMSLPLQLLGIVDGWAVLRDEGGAALAVIWSDGDYQAGLIRHRDTGEIAEDVTLEALTTGEYLVEGAIDFPGALLGCVL